LCPTPLAVVTGREGVLGVLFLQKRKK